MKSKFFASHSSEWRILASLVSGSGILLIQNLIQSERPDLLLLFLEPAIALAFSIVFFVPIWNKLKLQHEGDLIATRFDGRGAIVLKHFRNLLLAWIVIPLFISMHLAALPSMGWDRTISTLAIYAVVLLTVIIIVRGYHFDRMIQLEIVVAILTIAFSAAHCIFSDIPSSTSRHALSYSLGDFNLYGPPLLFFWWFSGLVDIPDMRAQKILQLKNTTWLRLKILLPYSVLFLIQSIYLWKPIHPEQWTFIPLIIVLLLNLLVLINSLLHWSASLMSQLSFRSNQSITSDSTYYIKGSQLLTLAIAMILFISGTTVQNLLSSVFFLTAGVGPIYILRWVWYRVNAWTQLTSMIGAILFSLIVHALCPHLNYYTQLGIAGAINITVSFIVMFATQNDQSNQKAKLFIERITFNNPLLQIRNWIAFMVLCILFVFILFSMQLFHHH